MPYSVLLIDDDVELGALMRDYLAQNGHDLTPVADPVEGLSLALKGDFDIILLDVMMPKMDGFTLLASLRGQSAIPVLMLTARGDEKSRIDGLQEGADDYLPKPFNPQELLARIQAILRRTKPETVSVSGITLEPAARAARRGDERIELTSVEYDILETLMRAAGRVVSRDELMMRLSQRPATPFDRSIDVHISHLRRKLESGNPLIVTVRGVGYQFARA